VWPNVRSQVYESDYRLDESQVAAASEGLKKEVIIVTSSIDRHRR